jgi:hypothetical protein
MKLPFSCIVGSDSEVVQNPFSGESITLSPQAVAVYDTIRGCEMIGDYKTVRKGLDWFRKYYPKEYMILLD